MSDTPVVVWLASGEQVWGRAAGAGQVQITSVPYPDEAGHRWGDVLLVDPGGDGTYVERRVVRRSDLPTVVVVVSAMPAHVDALLRACDERGWGFVNWTAAAGRSRPDAPQRLGIAAPPDQLAPLLDEWERWRRDRQIRSITVIE